MSGNRSKASGVGLERSCGEMPADWMRSTGVENGVECLEAWFQGAAYHRHRHDTYAICGRTGGVQAVDWRGAAEVSTPGQVVVLHPDELESFPMWEPERISDLAVDVVLECSGKKVAIEAGFNQLRRGGRLVMVGAGIEAPSFDPNRMLLNELEVCGSFVYDADGFERALDLLGSGKLRTDLLIDPVDVPLDGLGEAMQGLASGRIAGKAMVVPRPAAHPKEP